MTRDISKSIDIIRGMAALGVVWGHSMYTVDLPVDLNGAFWVWIFLPISGFLIGRGYVEGRYGLDRSGYSNFIFNRGLRIVPLYQIALLLGLAIEWVSATHETTAMGALRQMTFTTTSVTLAGPLWTIGAEIHFYLVSILVAVLVIRLRRPVLLGGLLLASFLVAGLYNGLVDGVLAQPRTLLGNFHFFVLGLVLSAECFQARLAVTRVSKTLLVAAPIGLAWHLQNWRLEYFWRFGTNANKFVPVGGASLLAMIVAIVVLCVTVKDESSRGYAAAMGRPVFRFLAWCGFYTYGIYVWHSVLAKLSVPIGVPLGVPMLGFLLLSIPLAVLSYPLIERPLLRFKRRAA